MVSEKGMKPKAPTGGSAASSCFRLVPGPKVSFDRDESGKAVEVCIEVYGGGRKRMERGPFGGGEAAGTGTEKKGEDGVGNSNRFAHFH